MGFLKEGKWHDIWYDTSKEKGQFKREKSQFRHALSTDSTSAFYAEPNRYHLYVSYACPWAHRTLIFRKLKQLESLISVSVVDPIMLENGWEFNTEHPDSLYKSSFLYEVYLKSAPSYEGRVTVPILWDKTKHCIVNNESSEIIRFFNTAFNHITHNTDDYYPRNLQAEINDINTFVYHNINNGVYKCGFATSQDAYNNAFNSLFDALDKIELRLSKQSYLVGNTCTEADWRLFTTLIRFDPVYVGHFKCNKKRIIDYPSIYDYLCRLYHMEGIKDTVFMDHIKTHYYASHKTINPTGIIPNGPENIISK